MNRFAPQISRLHRMALWEAHGRKCVYDGGPVSWDAVQIDHILPRSLWSDITGKRQVFEALGLPETFSPNNLENLVPCRALRNSQKNDWVFAPEAAHFFRQKAKEKKSEVNRWLEKLAREEEQDRIRSQAEAACEQSPALKQRLLEVLAATEPYPTNDLIAKDVVRISRPRVLLECILPKGEDYGSLLIKINTLYLHRVQITLDPHRILSVLFRGWGTDCPLEKRGFVVGPRADAPGEWFVHLGGTSVFLTEDEIEQLCDAVDRCAPHFINALQDREYRAGTLCFAPDGPEDVRLLTIKRSLWAEILHFSREHDYDAGNSEWHIFDSQGNSHIKTVLRTSAGEITPFCTYVYCTVDESDGIGPMIHPEDDVCLCWNASQSVLRSGATEDESPIGWNAQFTFDWLTQKLIPEVVRRSGEACSSMIDQIRSTLLQKAKPSYFSEVYGGVTPAIFCPLNSWSAATAYAEAAQCHYNCRSDECVPVQSMREVLGALALLADTLPVDSCHLGYFATKLGVDEALDLRTMVAAAQREIVTRGVHTGFSLDCALRCLSGILRDHAPQDGKQLELLSRLRAVLPNFHCALVQDVILVRTLKRLEHRSTWR